MRLFLWFLNTVKFLPCQINLGSWQLFLSSFFVFIEFYLIKVDLSGCKLYFLLVLQAAAASKQQEASKKKGDWRKKREEFIAALRAAKVAQRHLAAGGKISDLPPPPPSDNSDYIQCPHCQRRFNESVAERHIPKCKDIKSNKRR